MVLFRYKGETYYAETVPDVLSVIDPQEVIGIGNWDEYRYCGAAGEYPDDEELNRRALTEVFYRKDEDTTHIALIVGGVS